MTSRASRPLFAGGSAGDFPFDHEGANVVFRRVGMQRDFGAVEDAQQAALETQQTSHQGVERGISGFDAMENAAESSA